MSRRREALELARALELSTQSLQSSTSSPLAPRHAQRHKQSTEMTTDFDMSLQSMGYDNLPDVGGTIAPSDVMRPPEALAGDLGSYSTGITGSSRGEENTGSSGKGSRKDDIDVFTTRSSGSDNAIPSAIRSFTPTHEAYLNQTRNNIAVPPSSSSSGGPTPRHPVIPSSNLPRSSDSASVKLISAQRPSVIPASFSASNSTPTNSSPFAAPPSARISAKGTPSERTGTGTGTGTTSSKPLFSPTQTSALNVVHRSGSAGGGQDQVEVVVPMAVAHRGVVRTYGKTSSEVSPEKLASSPLVSKDRSSIVPPPRKRPNSERIVLSSSPPELPTTTKPPTKIKPRSRLSSPEEVQEEVEDEVQSRSREIIPERKRKETSLSPDPLDSFLRDDVSVARKPSMTGSTSISKKSQPTSSSSAFVDTQVSLNTHGIRVSSRVKAKHEEEQRAKEERRRLRAERKAKEAEEAEEVKSGDKGNQRKSEPKSDSKLNASKISSSTRESLSRNDTRDERRDIKSASTSAVDVTISERSTRTHEVLGDDDNDDGDTYDPRAKPAKAGNKRKRGEDTPVPKSSTTLQKESSIAKAKDAEENDIIVIDDETISPEKLKLKSPGKKVKAPAKSQKKKAPPAKKAQKKSKVVLSDDEDEEVVDMVDESVIPIEKPGPKESTNKEAGGNEKDVGPSKSRDNDKGIEEGEEVSEDPPAKKPKSVDAGKRTSIAAKSPTRSPTKSPAPVRPPLKAVPERMNSPAVPRASPGPNNTPGGIKWKTARSDLSSVLAKFPGAKYTGMSRKHRIPSLHTNIGPPAKAPPPMPQKPVKKKKGEESDDDDEDEEGEEESDGEGGVRRKKKGKEKGMEWFMVED